MAFLNNAGLERVWGKITAKLDTKVDKVSGKGLSTNDYTTTEKNKLAGIATGANKTTVDSALSSTSTNPVQNKVVNTAITNLNSLVGDTAVSTQISDYAAPKSHTHSAYVNQNAFSNVTVGSTTVAADSATDTLTLVAGSNVTLTPDATNDKITIAAKDTVYTHPSYTAKSAGLYKVTVDATGHVSATAAVTKDDITALGIPASDTNTHYASGTIVNNSTTATSNTTAALTNGNVYLNHIENGAVKNSHKISGSGATSVTSDTSGNIVISSTNTTYGTATTSANGLMSSSDKSKLDGIATGANKTTVDSALSTSSTNPVQNKLVTTEINSLKTLVGDTAVSTQITNGTNTFIKGLSVSGRTITYTKGDGTTGTITTQDTNTTYSNATTSAAGLMSKDDKAKLDAITASADSVSFSRSLTSGTKVGTITINGTGTDLYAPTNTDTHYTTGLKVGASNTATANAAASNGSVYLNVLDNTTVRDSHKITGGGATTVTSDANGVITISSTNTTYSTATTSANGLMSSSDKLTLNNLNTLVGDTAVSSQISSAVSNCISGLSVSGKTITYTKKDGSTGTIITQDTNVLQMDLLWTNASPTSSFSSQTVSVNKNGYQFIAIIFKRNTTSDIYKIEILHNSVTEYVVTAYNGGMGLVISRCVQIREGDSIVFIDAYKQIAFASDVIDNTQLIPYQIYGVK